MAKIMRLIDIWLVDRFKQKNQDIKIRKDKVESRLSQVYNCVKFMIILKRMARNAKKKLEYEAVKQPTPIVESNECQNSEVLSYFKNSTR